MAISEFVTGTKVVSTTEWSMSTGTAYATTNAQTTDGVYQAFIDLTTLGAGDVFEFKVYEKTTSSSTQRSVMSARFAGAQAMGVWVSPSLILINGWDMTLKKIAGTDHGIDWSIRSVA